MLQNKIDTTDTADKRKTIPFKSGCYLLYNREKRKLSREEVAACLGEPYSSLDVFCWEEGRSSIPLEVLEKLCAEWEISFSEILEGVQPFLSEKSARSQLAYLGKNEMVHPEHLLGLCLTYPKIVEEECPHWDIENALRKGGIR